mmetsp:Transcript_11451/g.20219  ORF Transcript_11451/g.20219 Transcript_11451/m.20219 type:complete len:510 (-) Transcript_11451:379-1908(-)|eukprot:CAMPEP_0119111268 /NCGR_PEP_ID=MMETSP1180-20130426/34834_1 /TAXON_ID=3052 ORGANISM="Chlamydomonas cf sp, Strain CCMP681" /NCGR_SAMPLE_ID=MMETSP1180 /ASSEMBLY_ACC=CAM_ASM_000741 /LENGTH=509 /DNA_ID=CAMNT_0007098143 /DNA_START=26 /DNA_END=1555 /DNA_ORIENTATION=+
MATSEKNANGHIEPVDADFVHPGVDAEQFRALGHQMVDWIADYQLSLDKLQRIRPDVQPGFLHGSSNLPTSAPEEPEDFSTVMTDFESLLLPGVVHWQAPKFFAYFPANTSGPSQLADMLVGALGMIGFSWAGSPVATELEISMMDWLALLMGLPKKFLFSSEGPGGGVIQSTTSDAVLVALVAARSKALQGRPMEDVVKLVAYCSDQAHSCVKKACMVAGTTNVRLIAASSDHEYALQPADLQAAMDADIEAGLIPFFFCATIGTTSSCAVDPVGALTKVAHAGGAWIHVDAAYAGSAAICEEQRELYFTGLEDVDSYSFNPHKWLLTGFDCCAMWAADLRPLRDALSLTPAYLQGKGNSLDFKDLQVPLGRRFRSLKLYFVLRMYGRQKLREYVRHHMHLAQGFAARVAADPRMELAATPRFALVCFRLRAMPREVQAAFLEAINAKGDMFLIHTELNNKDGVKEFTLRLSIGSPGTQARHVEEAWEATSQAADTVLAAHKLQHAAV